MESYERDCSEWIGSDAPIREDEGTLCSIARNSDKSIIQRRLPNSPGIDIVRLASLEESDATSRIRLHRQIVYRTCTVRGFLIVSFSENDITLATDRLRLDRWIDILTESCTDLIGVETTSGG